MAAAKYNTSVIQGDTFRKTFTLKNKATGQPKDFIVTSVSGSVAQGTSEIPLDCSVVMPPMNGTFRIELPASTTQTMSLGIWKLQVKLQDNSNGVIETVLMGNLVVVDDV